MKVSYNWLTDYLGDSAPTPEEIESLLTFHAFEIEGVEEVSGDSVIDVDVLPNRSSDCLSHRGIAREIATLTNIPLAHDPLATAPTLPLTEAITVTIEDSQDCPRFTASIINNVTVGPSPRWLQKRLEAIGQRSINNIVDATNYVMYALGQPLHAYDAEKFPQQDGVWQFMVRRANAGEFIQLLPEGGKTESRDIKLEGGELLIVDASTDAPIGLAGVKGGRYAEVDSDTTAIIVEAAHFDPLLTRQTARKHNIVIDASKRFENEPSRELPLYAQSEISTLIKEVAGGTYEGVLDRYLATKTQPEVTIRTKRVNALLGVSLSNDEVVALVERLGASVTPTGEGLVAEAPFTRTDLHIEEDYIEEIGRIYGFAKVPAVLPETVPVAEVNTKQYYAERIRQSLLALGYSEVITSSFRKKDQIQLRNALATDKSYVRSSLRKNIEESLTLNVNNLDLLGLDRVQVFEIGTVFKQQTNTIAEAFHIALGVRGKRSGHTPKDDAPLQEAMTAVNTTLGIELAWEVEAGVAETSLSAVLGDVPIPDRYDERIKKADTIYTPYSSYPAVARDIAMWVSVGTTAEEVETVLNEHAGSLRVRTTLFDEFTKDDRTSFAFRLVFQSYNKTLTDSVVNAIMDDIYQAVSERKWEVR